MTKQTGIVDCFEGDSVVVEVNGEMVNFDRADAPAMLCEGMVVIIKDDRIVDIDEIETQRMENDMRRHSSLLLASLIPGGTTSGIPFTYITYS